MAERAALHFTELDPWLAACRERGVSGVVLREVDEVRAVCDERGVTVAPTRRSTLLAYHQGLLLRAVLSPPPEDLGLRLRDEGLSLRVVRDHIG